MTSAETTALIERAIALAQEHTKYFPLAPGTVAGHPREPIAANFDGYDGEEAILSWADGRTARFPRYEVCDVNLVHSYAGLLQLNLAVDPSIQLNDREHGDHGVFVLKTTG